jgi:hypothetical protein
MSRGARLSAHGAVSTSLALCSDRALRELVDAAVPIGSGIGGKSALLEVAGTSVFVKRVPPTDPERQPENVRSTANLFALPLFCQYGIVRIPEGGPRRAGAQMRRRRASHGHPEGSRGDLYPTRVARCSDVRLLSQAPAGKQEDPVPAGGDPSARRDVQLAHRLTAPWGPSLGHGSAALHRPPAVPEGATMTRPCAPASNLRNSSEGRQVGDVLDVVGALGSRTGGEPVSDGKSTIGHRSVFALVFVAISVSIHFYPLGWVSLELSCGGGYGEARAFTRSGEGAGGSVRGRVAAAA